MALGIWTPAVNSAVQVVFDGRLNNFADKLKTTPLAAGTHMMVQVIGCLPVFIHASAPANDAAGLTGTMVTEDAEFVMPRVSPIWIYSPYENSTVNVQVGTLT